MGTILSSAMSGQQPGKGLVVVDSAAAKSTKKTIDIKASIFFDGTYNNRANVTLAQKNPNVTSVVVGFEKVRPNWFSPEVTQVRAVNVGSDSASYGDRTFSNIAKMEYMNDIQDAETQISVYVEGAGTADYQPVDQIGGGFGSGPTGIPAKVTIGIVKLAADVQSKLKSDKRLGTLTVDVYGFSRGATAARHFVARRANLWQFSPPSINLADTLGVAPIAIVINFVGLFDTVSSYGSEGIAHKLNFNDDVGQLRLAIGGDAKRVFQLAAGNEYRVNFASTNIDSSVAAGVGYQCTIPGDHPDVGGSYKDTTEERMTWVGKAERDDLVRDGWYTDHQMPPPRGILQLSTHTQGTRTVKGGYQAIPLSLMIIMARKQEATFQPFSNEFARYKVPTELEPLYALMRESVIKREDPRFDLPPDMIKKIRNQYIHHALPKLYTDLQVQKNAGDVTVNRVRKGKNGKLEREIISDATRPR